MYTHTHTLPKKLELRKLAIDAACIVYLLQTYFRYWFWKPCVFHIFLTIVNLGVHLGLLFLLNKIKKLSRKWSKWPISDGLNFARTRPSISANQSWMKQCIAGWFASCQILTVFPSLKHLNSHSKIIFRTYYTSFWICYR